MEISNLTSENILLGSIINDLYYFVKLPNLESEYFSTSLNKNIFIALKKLFKDGCKNAEITDIYAILETYKTAKEEIDKSGGLEYLDDLKTMGEGKEEEEVLFHANRIISYSYKKSMLLSLDTMKQIIESNMEMPINILNKKVEDILSSLKTKYSGLNRIERLGSRMDKLLADIDRERTSEGFGYPTFSPTLNKFVRYEKGELLIVSAKAKAGKSQWIVNELYNLCIKQKEKIPILILDTELDDKMILIRLLARVTGFNFNYIKNGLYKDNPVENKIYEDALNLIKEAPIFHQYIVGWSNSEILNEVKRLKIQENIQILFYDYLKIENAGEGIAEHQQLGNLTNFLKNDIAGALKIAVCAFAQQSDYSDRGLRIANSEKIKNYASTVIFLLQKSSEQSAVSFNDLSGNYYIFIAFNRNGPQMDMENSDIGINITFKKNNAMMCDARQDEEFINRLLMEYDDSVPMTKKVVDGKV